MSDDIVIRRCAGECDVPCRICAEEKKIRDRLSQYQEVIIQLIETRRADVKK